MLEKVICIDNVGVIKKGAPKSADLQKVALVYADNARGKSTLSSLLLACSGGDVQGVVSRKTVGATTDQKVILRFNPLSGEAAFNVEFDGTTWKGPRPGLHVFNQTFVERNVFASNGVQPDQREALLTLALGDAAVVERTKFERYSGLQRESAGKVAAAEGALVGFRGNHTVDQFIAFAPLSDFQQQLADVDKKIGEARDAVRIVKRPHFKTIEVPSFNFDGLSEVVGSSFTSLVAMAEKLVKAHLAKHSGSKTEQWVAEGLNHQPEAECPFCGQATRDLEILDAYRAYFDKSYAEHSRRVARLRIDVSERLHGRQLDSWKAGVEFNHGLLSVWAESLALEPIPEIDFATVARIFASVELALFKMVKAKERDPLAALDPKPFATALIDLGSITAMAKAYNVRIEELNALIGQYKAKIAGPDLAALNSTRSQLVIRGSRHEAKVVSLVDAVTTARAEYKAAESSKNAARAELDKLMADTLLKFEVAINEWLLKFAAPFKLEKLAPSYAGGGLRSAYVLKVRGATVNVGPGASGELSFQSALSEGDKRTLAFAFFLAKLFADPKRASAIVVLDDVFTSLDKHRRHNTIDAVLKMVSECAQVIALAHDAHFLREIKKRVSKKKLGSTSELALHRDGHDYSYLDVFDLDDYCASEYYKHYVLVEKFVNAEPSGSLLEVAKSLRLLVEGHMHRCFPKKFREGQTVGEMLEVVKNATPENPVIKLQSLHADLSSFNEFAAAFHHETSGGYTRMEVNEGELLPFAKGALGFIQVRSFK